MTTNAYAINGQLGIDVTAAGVTTPQFAVGTRVRLSDGSEWIYVKASATCNQYDMLGVSDDATCAGLTTTLASTGVALAVAQQALTSGSYYWVLTANPTPPAVASAGVPASTDNYKVRTAASCAVNAKLATTATAGTIDDTTAGTSLRIDNIVLTDTNTTSTTSARTFRTSVGGMVLSGTLAI